MATKLPHGNVNQQQLRIQMAAAGQVFLWTRYAVDAGYNNGFQQVTVSAQAPPAGTSPVWQLDMSGPSGGATQVPQGTIYFWEFLQYMSLPCGYQGTISRIA